MKVFRDGFTEFCRLEYDAGLYPHKNNTDDSLRWDKQQSFENNYFARQQRKVSLKLYNLALPALCDA